MSVEHWFDRATKMFAGGAVSRRGLLEGGALAGTAVVVAQTPGLARGSSSTPCSLTGDGSSTFTLSVLISTIGSYFSIFSPGCFSHLSIVPSVTSTNT